MAIPSNLPQRGNIQLFCQLDEGASGNAIDSSDNGYDLIETSGTIAQGATAKIGTSRDFELADSEYFTIAHAACPNLQITGEITISMWLKPESISIQYILCKSGASGKGVI